MSGRGSCHYQQVRLGSGGCDAASAGLQLLTQDREQTVSAVRQMAIGIVSLVETAAAVLAGLALAVYSLDDRAVGLGQFTHLRLRALPLVFQLCQFLLSCVLSLLQSHQVLQQAGVAGVPTGRRCGFGCSLRRKAFCRQRCNGGHDRVMRAQRRCGDALLIRRPTPVARARDASVRGTPQSRRSSPRPLFTSKARLSTPPAAAAALCATFSTASWSSSSVCCCW